MVKHRSPKAELLVRVQLGPQRRNNRGGGFSLCGKRSDVRTTASTALSGGARLTLALRFFENNALAECRIEFRDFDLAFHGLFVLAAPNDVI